MKGKIHRETALAAEDIVTPKK